MEKDLKLILTDDPAHQDRGRGQQSGLPRCPAKGMRQRLVEGDFLSEQLQHALRVIVEYVLALDRDRSSGVGKNKADEDDAGNKEGAKHHRDQKRARAYVAEPVKDPSLWHGSNGLFGYDGPLLWPTSRRSAS